MPISPFHQYFAELHAPTDQWLDLQELLVSALRDVPSHNHILTLFVRAGESRQDASDRCMSELFDPRAGVVSAAFVSRLMEGERPDDLSDEDRFCIQAILKTVLRLTTMLAPLPNLALRQTILPFPNGPVEIVALWFCTEWWASTGGHQYRRDLREK